MILKDKVGFACDCCGVEHRHEFTYYSLDFKTLAINSNRFPADTEQIVVILSLDFCDKCMDKLADIIKVNYVPTNVGVNCDICKTQLRGNFTVHKCAVSSVIVSFAGGTISCHKCQKIVVSGDTCKCGSSELIKTAATKIDADHLQLMICERDYKDLMDNATAKREMRLKDG